MCVGDLDIPWVTVWRGDWQSQYVGVLDPTEPQYPDFAQRLTDEFTAQMQARTAEGDQSAWDGRTYKLLDIDVDPSNVLTLRFCLSTYFRGLALDARCDQPMSHGGTLRELYAFDAVPGSKPVREFMCMAGNVQVLVLTADGRAVLSRRSALAVEPYLLGGAAAEGGDPDLDGPGAPDPTQTTQRALREELSLEPHEYELTPLAFGVETDLNHYTFLSLARTDLTVEALEARRCSSPASWEARELVSYSWDAAGALELLADQSAWLMSATAALVVEAVKATMDDSADILQQAHGHAGRRLPAWCYTR